MRNCTNRVRQVNHNPQPTSTAMSMYVHRKSLISVMIMFSQLSEENISDILKVSYWGVYGRGGGME